MQKTKAKIVTALLLTAMTLTLFPLANASVGFITIVTSPPSVPAGGIIHLDLNSVTWSGGQFYLLLSADGFSQVSPGDIRFTPSFSRDALLAPATTTYANDPTYPGSWDIGFGQILGTIPTNVAGGSYYIKAFDGAVTSLAVTGVAFTITASIAVKPATGPGGAAINITGNAFPKNALVNITYLNPVTAAYVTVNNLTATGDIGEFVYPAIAPDIIGPALNVPGDNVPGKTNTIQFQVTDNKTGVMYTANYAENQRGLLQIGRPKAGPVAGNLQNATGVYGNLTDFTGSISVGVGDSLRIAGNWFYPGSMTIKWDNSVDITPSGLVANETGYFNTTVTVPTARLGTHNVTIVDNGLVVFAAYVNVVQSITIDPTSGPIGTTVTVNGYGFPAAGTPAGNAYNATITFGTSTKVLNWSLTDANGQFTTTFVVPTAPGGANAVTATTNDTLLTSASKTFTVKSLFAVSPTEFYANSSNTAVVASGTGFDPANRYFVAIDNVFSPFSNTTDGIAPNAKGELSITFMGVGFQPGLHVVALYIVNGNNKPAENATFTVLGETGEVLTAINSTLTAVSGTVTNINGTVTNINTNLGMMNATLVALNGNIATLMTSVGTISTDIATIKPQITSISNGIATVTSTVGTLQASLSSLDAKLTGVSGTVGTINSGMATISTSIGTITSSLSSIGTTVTSIKDGVATVKTDLGTLQGSVTATDGKVATIQTSIGALTADVADVQTSVDAVPGAVNLPIWIAVILALVAAIASILCLVLMRRKIAG